MASKQINKIEKEIKNKITDDFVSDLVSVLNKQIPIYVDYIKEGVTFINDDVGLNFYKSYNPRRYNRRKSNGKLGTMRSLLEINQKDLSLTISTDADRMGRFRKQDYPNKASTNFDSGGGVSAFDKSNGNGLYHLAYEMGYHGGALVTPKNVGKSPKSYIGTYRYRTGYRFSTWGEKAERADVSPRLEFRERISEFIENSYVRFAKDVAKGLNDLGYKTK